MVGGFPGPAWATSRRGIRAEKAHPRRTSIASSVTSAYARPGEISIAPRTARFAFVKLIGNRRAEAIAQWWQVSLAVRRSSLYICAVVQITSEPVQEPVAGTFTPLDECAVRMVDSARVADTRDRLLDIDEAEQLGGLFRLLGDRNRVRILFALAEAGELCVCDLAAAVDVAEPAVSQALRLQRAAGVVRSRRDGRTVWHRLDDEHVRLLLDLSRTHLSPGS